MPTWARVTVLLVGMAGWVAMVGVSLFGLKQIPDAVLIGFPAGLWLAVGRGGSRVTDEEDST